MTWSIFYEDSVALNLLEFQHILTYQTSSDQNAVALLSLCPNLKPKQETGHPGLLLLLGTLFRREGKYTLLNTYSSQGFSWNCPLPPWHFPQDQEKNFFQTYPSPSKALLLCPAHQNLESQPTSPPKSHAPSRVLLLWTEPPALHSSGSTKPLSSPTPALSSDPRTFPPVRR